MLFTRRAHVSTPALIKVHLLHVHFRAWCITFAPAGICGFRARGLERVSRSLFLAFAACQPGSPGKSSLEVMFDVLRLKFVLPRTLLDHDRDADPCCCGADEPLLCLMASPRVGNCSSPTGARGLRAAAAVAVTVEETAEDEDVICPDGSYAKANSSKASSFVAPKSECCGVLPLPTLNLRLMERL